jgi:hypothetical protein
MELSHKFAMIVAMDMRIVLLLLIGALASGCIATRKTGMAYQDEYDAIRVEQTVGNSVSARPLQKVIVCLNPRRETRRVNSYTNPVVSVYTNVSLVYVTNQTILATTNWSRTFSTNQFAVPPPPPTLVATNESGDLTANVETNTSVTLSTAPPPAPNSTNNTLTASGNVIMSRAPTQTSLTANHQQLLNRQVTLNTTNMTLVTADNEVVSIETNMVVNTYTNLSVSSVTNYNVIYTNGFVRDYYLYTEFTPPQDFTLQSSGESLILLVDGARHGLMPASSGTAFVARKGFQTTLYRVPPELIADIANAKEVKLRLKGVNSVIERKMNAGSRVNFRRFMLKFFTPEAQEDDAPPAVQKANITPKYETN